MRTRRLLATGCLFAALLVPATSGSSLDQNDPLLMVHASSQDSGRTFVPGTAVPLLGRGFPPGATGPLQLGTGHRVGAYTADGRGMFEETFQIPADHGPGPALVVACQLDRFDNCTAIGTVSFGVAAAPTTTTTTAQRPTTTQPPIATTTTSTTTQPPIVVVTSTTAPPVTDPPIGIVTTTTDVGGPDSLGTPSTTVGGFPTAPTSIGPDQFGVETTTTQLSEGAVLPNHANNLAIEAVEVTQGLQDLDNTFPLVANRRTSVRVHGVVTEGESQAAVTGAIQVLRVANGQETELGILFDENPGGVTFHDTRRRLDNAAVPWFDLPTQWAHGTLKIRAWVYAHDDVTAALESDSTDNLAEVTVTFTPGRAIHLWMYSLFLTDEDDNPAIVDPSVEWLPQVMHVYRELPVPLVIGHPMGLVVGNANSDWDLTKGSPTMGAPLSALLTAHTLDGKADNDHYVGLVHPDVPTHFGGLARGLGEPVLWTKWHSGFNGVFRWNHVGGTILAHELGHNMGINHAPCLFDVGDPFPGEAVGGPVDNTFPGSYGFPACSLAPRENDGYFGWDVAWQLTAMNEPAVLSNVPYGDKEPQYALPFMGYKYPGWVDPWHGCLVLQFVEVGCDQLALGVKDLDGPDGGHGPGGIPTPGHAVPLFNCDEVNLGEKGGGDLCGLTLGPSGDPTASEPVDTDGFLVIVGWVDPDNGAGDLVRMLSVPDRTTVGPVLTPGGAPADHHLVLWAGDEIVSIRPVVTETGGAHAAEEGGPEWFAVKVPAVEGLTEVTLTGPEGVLDDLGPAGAGPTGGLGEIVVTDTLSVPVVTEDPEGGPVWTYLQWSPTGQAPWTTFGVEIDGSVEGIDLSTFSASESGTVRLLVTDGWTTAVTSVDGVAIRDVAPDVIVVAPVDGSSRPAGRPIGLTSQAIDGTDGVLGDAAITWASDIDGDLGSGASLSVSTLSVGTHQLTVTAIDSAGNAASESVSITVTESDLPPAELVSMLSDVVFVGASSHSDSDSESGSGFAAAAIVGAVAVLSLAAGFVLTRRRRASA